MKIHTRRLPASQKPFRSWTNAEQFCPYIIKRIGYVRKQHRLTAVKKGQKTHSQYIVRPYAHKYLLFCNSVIICQSLNQHPGGRVRISPQPAGVQLLKGFCDAGSRRVWIFIGIKLYECPKLNDEFQIRTEDYIRECGGIVIPNPNAPTGIEKNLEELEEVIAANPQVIVIIDEAYIDFGGTSALSLLPKYENLLVVQTFSKSRSLAGMRIGFAIGNERLISYLNDAKYSFNSYTMSAAALAAGTEAIKDDTYFRETLQKIINTREWTKKELRRLGFSCLDSKSNFIFASHPKRPARELFEALKQADIKALCQT